MTGTCCCAVPPPSPLTGPYRRALWVALAINVAMFVVEFAASFGADSTSLLADAIDFAGDAANYGLSLGALALGVRWESRAALAKGASMVTYGVGVLAFALWRLASGSAPEPMVMGVVGGLALLANITVALLLYRHRDGTANMRSVWRCSRNDALANVAVMLAAAGVFGMHSNLPDLAVAGVIAGLAIVSGTASLREARAELRAGAATPCSGIGGPARNVVVKVVAVSRKPS